MISISNEEGKVVLDFGGAEIQVRLKGLAVNEAFAQLDEIRGGNFLVSREQLKPAEANNELQRN